VHGDTGIDARVPTQYASAREYLSAARTHMDQVKQLLSHPSLEGSEQSAGILRQVEVQLGCAASILKASGSSKPDLETRAVLEDLQREVAVLAQFFAEADKFVTGWLQAIQTKRAGYTSQGHAAPLMLVNKMRLEG